jgi:predicted membrane-bound dolichyl-phosphate-mannose-protein mannosyltransferase
MILGGSFVILALIHSPAKAIIRVITAKITLTHIVLLLPEVFLIREFGSTDIREQTANGLWRLPVSLRKGTCGFSGKLEMGRLFTHCVWLRCVS